MDCFNQVHFHALAGMLLEEQLDRSSEVELGSAKPTRQPRMEEKATARGWRAAANTRARNPLMPEQLAAKKVKLDSRLAHRHFLLSATGQLPAERVKGLTKAYHPDRVS